jgi:hypothetical protein
MMNLPILSLVIDPGKGDPTGFGMPGQGKQPMMMAHIYAVQPCLTYYLLPAAITASVNMSTLGNSDGPNHRNNWARPCNKGS